MDDRLVDDTGVDIELLERVAARDEQAISLLYDRHSRLLFGLILRVLRNRSDAEEALQEVFLAVWTKAESYNRTLGPPVAWLVRIARNRAIDGLRANEARSRNLPPVDLSQTDPPASAGDNPEVRAVRSELERGIARTLGLLPPEQRQLIEAAYYQGFTHSELAEQFGLPLGTVKTRVRAGMTTLRQALEQMQMEHG